MPLRISKNRVALDGIPLNESKASNLASAATIDIWSTTGNLIPITGTATVSAFTSAPQAGTKRTLLCIGTPTFTHSANFLLPGAADYTAIAGDRIEVVAITTTQFRLSILQTSVLNFATKSVFPTVGVDKALYLDKATGLLWRWDTGTGAYVGVGSNNGTAVTIGAGGTYETMSLFAAYLKAGSWLTPITITDPDFQGITASVTNGSTLVTFTNSDIGSAHRVRKGDCVSFDAGVIWYQIEVPWGDAKVLLECVYTGTTAASATPIFARPTYVKAVVLPGTHGLFKLDDSTVPIFVSMHFRQGAVIDGNGTGSPISAVLLPGQGRITMFNPQIFVGYNSTIGAAISGVDAMANGYLAQNVLELIGGSAYVNGVDMFSPSGVIGKVLLTDGYYESHNDCMYTHTTTGIFMNGVTLKGVSVNIFSVNGWNIRMFTRQLNSAFPQHIYAKRSSFIIDSRTKDSSVGNRMFPLNNILTNSERIFTDCEFAFYVADSGGATFVDEDQGASTPVATLGGVTINGGSIAVYSTTNTVPATLVAAAVHTGTGYLTLNGVLLKNISDGGGGTFTLTKNGCIAAA